MYGIYVFTIASMKMFLRNRQALLFSLFMPFVILFIFGNMHFDAPTKLTIGVVTHSPTPLTTEFLKQMRKVEALVIKEGTLDSELVELRLGNRVAVLDVPDDLVSPPGAAGPPQLTLFPNERRPIEAGIVLSILDQAAGKAALAMARVQPLFTIKRQSIVVRSSRYIDFLTPGVVAMAVMQMSVFSVAFAFARYRERGIFKRLMVTPLRSYQFLTANIITRLVLSVVQAAILIATAVACFQIQIAGSLWLLSGCVVLGSLLFLGLGLTVSGLSTSAESAPVIANVIVFPMLFLGNVFFSGSRMPEWLQPVAHNLPLTFFSDALRGIMTDGVGIQQIQRPLIGMLIWAVALITLATLTFKIQYRDNA